jgi:imidazolonepropionase
MPNYDTLVLDVHLATMAPGDEPYGAIRDGAIALSGGRIEWLGPASELEGDPEALAARVLRGAGGWVLPGLLDCHTHLVFGGDRVDEFERRLQGTTYEEIARAGGGIRSTVRRTREASDDSLLRSARLRLGGLLGEGVTTVEIKSGYGLETETEMRMLRAARSLGRSPAVDVQTTLLAAHALPPEYEGRRSDYLRLVCEEMIPRAVDERLVDAVDAFCESIAFSVAECGEVFDAAREHGLPVRIHADQLSDGGGAALAARYGARSADHLEHASEEGARAMADAGTVAVLLPGAFYFLRDSNAPPVEAFRRYGVPIALGSDLNPGSSPARSLLLMLSMGCVLFGLTPGEALAGVTRNAALALGLLDDRGTLEVGKRADLAVWDVRHPAELAYWMGGCVPRLIFKDGVPRTPSEASRTLAQPAPTSPAGERPKGANG